MMRAFLNEADHHFAAACLQPQHVCGMHLDSLSLSQLEILEKHHMSQLTMLCERKVRLTRDLERSQCEEKILLREQLDALDTASVTSAKSLLRRM